MRFARDTTVVLSARRLQLNMFLVPKVSRTTPQDYLLKSRPCHVPCSVAMSKFCVLGITRGRDYHTHRSDTRLFAFPLITDTSSSLAIRKAMTPCGDNNDLCYLSEKDASDRVDLRNIYARDSSRALSKRGQARRSSRVSASHLVFKTSCWTAGERECLGQCCSTEVVRHPNSRKKPV